MRATRSILARASLVALLAAGGCGVDHEALQNFHVARGRTVVFLGDSLTAGARLGKERAFPALLAEVLPYDVVNAGENGDTTGDALARFDRDVAPHAPAIVVVLIGGNDGLRRSSREGARENVRRIVDRIVEIGAVPVVLGFRMGLFGAGFTSFLEEVAEETGALYLDDALDDVLRSPALKIDQIHPNEEGHARIAAALEGPLGDLVRALESR